MPHLRIDFTSDHPEISLDDLVARIVASIPGSKITAEDWYAERRASEERVIRRLKQMDRPTPLADRVLDSIDRAAVECGPAKRIQISMGGSSLEGRISRNLILLHSDALIDESTADRLLHVLEPLGVVREFHVSDVYVAK